MNRQRSSSNVDAGVRNGLAGGRERSSGNALRYTDFENEMRRSNTTGRGIGEGLKRRIGSLRKGRKGVTADM